MVYLGGFPLQREARPGRKVYLSVGRHKLILGYWRATRTPRLWQAPFFSMMRGSNFLLYFLAKKLEHVTELSNVSQPREASVLILVVTHG